MYGRCGCPDFGEGGNPESDLGSLLKEESKKINRFSE